MTGRTAHPRSHGENEALAASDATDKGSSPLTRGKQTGTRSGSRCPRLIPTHAGKTHARGAWSSQAGAHPHSRGENLEDARTDNLHDGSSPLTRGKRTRPHARAGDPRLIPTHAGKTQLTWLSTCPPRAHPHSRGENWGSALECRDLVGSSPLTRGKHYLNRPGVVQGRLIPTHAGKTRRGWHPRAGSRAHPHSRGENNLSHERHCLASGSSPLTRGKPVLRLSSRCAHRLIPTHAGKTSLTRSVSSTGSAHPHSRGENNDKPHRTDPVGGSSPLTRGKPLGGPFLDGGSGLIPAHAGKTNKLLLGLHTDPGSSPLTRGKR